ncbi:hypothetical protein D9M68_509740 [compost metagenome]
MNIKDERGGPLRDDAADILAHELVGHAIPRIIGGGTGNAISNENKVREQVLGGGRRMENSKHLEWFYVE